MIRLLGIGMIAVSTAVFGISYASSLYHELRVLRAFWHLTERIRSRIECFCQPLSDIYPGFSDPTLEACGFTEELQRSGFTVALCKCKGALGLRPAYFAMLAEYGEGLGKSFAEEQLRHCQKYQKELENAVKHLEEELPTRAKLIRTLSLAVAAMAVILLL